MGIWHLEAFLFKFSIHVGIVTICSIGIMLMATSLWVNSFTRDPEIWQMCRAVHWTVVSVFDISGLGTYTLGMIAAYSESSRLATVLLACLILHSLLWLTLTALSFRNSATLNRAVCIDNRCADRLFIKNGNWRINFDGYCFNPSEDRWLEKPSSGNHPINYESHGEQKKARIQNNLYSPGRDTNEANHDVLKVLLNKNASAEALGNKSEPGGRRLNVFSNSGYNKSLVHTPIGYMGCNATAHVAYSAVCAFLILVLWYIYPILIVKSHVDNLKRRRLSVQLL